MGSRRCWAVGCGNPTLAKGLCRKHYYRFRMYGSPYVLQRYPQPSHCEVPGCTREADAHNKCGAHLQRTIRHSDPLAHVEIGDRHGVWLATKGKPSDTE